MVLTRCARWLSGPIESPSLTVHAGWRITASSLPSAPGPPISGERVGKGFPRRPPPSLGMRIAYTTKQVKPGTRTATFPSQRIRATVQARRTCHLSRHASRPPGTGGRTQNCGRSGFGLGPGGAPAGRRTARGARLTRRRARPLLPSSWPAEKDCLVTNLLTPPIHSTRQPSQSTRYFPPLSLSTFATPSPNPARPSPAPSCPLPPFSPPFLTQAVKRRSRPT